MVPGWLEPPTQGMVLHFSIMSKPNNCLIWFRLIMIKTEAGLYEMDYQTSYASLKMFNSPQ
jgi:hypothetical protein